MTKKIIDYCDVCERKKELQEVILNDDAGRAFYCDDCVKNNPHVKLINN